MLSGSHPQTSGTLATPSADSAVRGMAAWEAGRGVGTAEGLCWLPAETVLEVGLRPR